MTNQEKLEVIEEAFNYYHDRNSLTSEDEKELITLVNEVKAAISVTRCSTQLNITHFRVGFKYEELEMDGERYFNRGLIWKRKTYGMTSPRLYKIQRLLDNGKLRHI
tara:strand:- start:363 stop:683 length:321 start_codon:yes stop_codon:yes gene_type:complete